MNIIVLKGCIIIIILQIVHSVLLVHLDTIGQVTNIGIIIYSVSFCIDCPNPSLEGSLVNAIKPKFSISKDSLIGEIIHCLPNYAETKRLINNEQINNKIVLVTRGLTPILDKCNKLQQAGAIGIIIADDGQCDEEFKYCGARSGNVYEGFAPFDGEMDWKLIHIPIVLISSSSADRLRKLMNVRYVEIPGYGFNNVSYNLNADGTYEEL